MKGKCIKTSLPSKVKYHGHLVPCPGDDSSLKGPKSFTVKNHSKSADSFDLVCFFIITLSVITVLSSLAKLHNHASDEHDWNQ